MADNDTVEIRVAQVGCWVDQLNDGTWVTTVSFSGLRSLEEANALGAALRTILMDHLDELPFEHGSRPKFDA